MEKSCLTEVKAILKSLVLSSTDKMTIEQLNRDYRDTEGESIPFRRLGYASIEEFLNAIPDTLRIFGSGPTALVCFVANEKSDHIHDMIMQQKKSKNKARNRSRGRPSANNRFNNIRPPVKKSISGHQLSPFQNVNRQCAVRTVKLWNGPPPLAKNFSASNFYILPQPCGIVLNNANVRPTPEINIRNYEEHVKQVSNLLKTNCFITRPPPPPLPLSKQTANGVKNKEIQPVKETKAVIDSKIQPIKETKAVTDPEVQEKKSNATTPSRNSILEHIKVPKAKDKSQPIKLSSDIERLITKRRHVKFLNSIKDDSPSDSTSEELLNKSTESKVTDVKSNEISNKLFDTSNEEGEQNEEAVPSFAAKYNVFRLDFPKHTVPFGNKIAAYKIPNDLEIGSCIKIFVSEIHSPFRFWFHIHKEAHELDTLMFQIERYYSTLGVEDLRIPLTSLMSGQVCAARYHRMWHRAEIVAPPVRNTIKVLFMDYGTVTEVKLEEVKFLASYFAQLPAQALRGCLSHIKPRHLHWSHEASLHFLNLTSDKMLYAKITEIDTQHNILYMVLCNTCGDEVVQINKSLVEHRYAWYSEEWKIEIIQKNGGKRVHHPHEDFPT